jgi:hypothetical protein
MVAEYGQRWELLCRPGFSYISKGVGIKLDLARSNSVMHGEGLEGPVRGQESDEIWAKGKVRRKPT